MRCLTRNKRRFYYALFNSKNELLDENGYFTGDYELKYGNPVSAMANISAAKGEVTTRQFGEELIYDKVVVMDNPRTEIDEYAVMWIDSVPVLEADGTTKTPHDYVVKQVARSLNSVSIAAAKVDVQ